MQASKSPLSISPIKQTVRPSKAPVHSFFIKITGLICILVLLSSCSGGTPQTTQTAVFEPTQPPTALKAEVTFVAQLIAPLKKSQNLYVEVLDEVTGLALNPTRVKMTAADPLKYTLTVPFELGSVVKYRYIRDNESSAPIEYTSHNEQVRYRLHYVDGPGTAQDVITGWKNDLAKGPFGRITGNVAVQGSNAPVVNALVTAGGVHTLTASDGSFILEGLPAGTQTLVAYALDGSFKVFQQGAVVAPDATTPALVQVVPAKTVTITFKVTPPPDSFKGFPLRLIGNIYALGNTFADLRGGVSVEASRAPLMLSQADGSYQLALKMPVGLDLRYKYTLGDGFWNAEHNAKGDFLTRQLIVPNKDTTINDTVESWAMKGNEPISFTVTVPKDTPANDTVSIQFNPYGWTEPLPMWPLGGDRWFFMLYSPLNVIKTAGYRYCRNEQCGVADASDTAGKSTSNKTFSAANTNKTITDTVATWAWWENSGQPVTVSSAQIKPRVGGFMAGVEFVAGYHPSWQPYFTWAYQSLKDMGANTVIIAPTWHWTYQNPPVVEPVPGQDALWMDLTATAFTARQHGLDIMIHPTTIITGGSADWWKNAARDDNWWQSWFDRYHTFMMYYADLATQTGAKALILGDDSIAPALPLGLLADGSSSNVPGDAESRWSKLITDIRARYKGQLVWEVNLTAPIDPNKAPAAPDFTKSVDQLYVQVYTPVTNASQVTQAALDAGFAHILDLVILPLQKINKQPILLSLLYPASDGAAVACVQAGSGCLDAAGIQQPAFQQPGVQLSFAQQTEVYNAALTGLNDRPWITGFFASGFYPPVALRDSSTSVRGKPSADVLWYWYPRLIGKGP